MLKEDFFLDDHELTLAYTLLYINTLTKDIRSLVNIIQSKSWRFGKVDAKS